LLTNEKEPRSIFAYRIATIDELLARSDLKD